MKTRQATPEMRRVTFNLLERLVLVPVEISHYFLRVLAVVIILGFLAGWTVSLAAVTSFLAGAVLFPLLLPWIPTRDFSSKGLILGGLAVLPFAVFALFNPASFPLWLRIAFALTYLLFMPPVTAYLSLNFTGSTTFTSKTGVEREMSTYIRIMAWMFGTGALLLIALTLFRWFAL
jgi:hypothetical protein